MITLLLLLPALALSQNRGSEIFKANNQKFPDLEGARAMASAGNVAGAIGYVQRRLNTKKLDAMETYLCTQSLADWEWLSGNTSQAQQRYASIVERTPKSLSSSSITNGRLVAKILATTKLTRTQVEYQKWVKYGIAHTEVSPSRKAGHISMSGFSKETAFWIVVGRHYFEMGLIADAMRAYGRALATRPREQKINFELSTSLYIQGLTANAAKVMNSVPTAAFEPGSTNSRIRRQITARYQRSVTEQASEKELTAAQSRFRTKFRKMLIRGV
jgi:tetratricopeptide (TPR) repeat protein